MGALVGRPADCKATLGHPVEVVAGLRDHVNCLQIMAMHGYGETVAAGESLADISPASRPVAPPIDTTMVLLIDYFWP